VNYLDHLWLFFVIVFGIVVLPGMDMAYILGSALTGGTRMGFMALFGIVAGAVYHVVIGTLGIGIVIKLFPALFNGLLLAGSLYIAWIGWSIMQSAAAIKLQPETQKRSALVTFRRGIVTNMLNPKAYLFTLAIYPQFFRPEYGPLVPQAFVMWLIIAFTQISVYGSVVLAAHGVRRWFTGNPGTGMIVGRIVGVVLILSAAWTAYTGWRAL